MSVLKIAVETYGKDMQLNVAIEELSELIKEICKNKRGADNREAIIEETVDCYIMLAQIGIVFEITSEELFGKYGEKLGRLKKRLEKSAGGGGI